MLSSWKGTTVYAAGKEQGSRAWKEQGSTSLVEAPSPLTVMVDPAARSLGMVKASEMLLYAEKSVECGHEAYVHPLESTVGCTTESTMKPSRRPTMLIGATWNEAGQAIATPPTLGTCRGFAVSG